jgi:hypothetical protein
VLPALAWPKRFRRLAVADQQMLLKVAEWGRPRLIEEDAKRLIGAAERVRFHPSLMTLAMTGVAFAMAAVAWGLTQVQPGQNLGSWLLAMTFGALWPRYSAIGAETPAIVYTIWTLGLIVAYSAHLIQVHLHAHSLRRFIDEFNQLSIAEGYAPVLLEPIGFGFSPIWVLTAGSLLMLSGVWAIPLAIAGATENRLRKRAIKKLRADLTGRIRDIIFARARASEINLPAAAYCATPGCRRPLSKGVKFCPRCGARAGRSIDRKA